MSGKWLAAGAAFLLLAAACAPPKNTITLTSPTPSPSPTPTTPLAMTGPTFHVGEVGVAYASVSYSATGGVQPYHWAVSAGALPGGMTLGSDGSISGTPTTSGDFSFTIGVADSGDSNQTATGKISIVAPLSASLIAACAKYCNVELGCVDVCGNFGALSGGVGPYSYTMTQGPLPAGTSLSGLSLTGTFRGSSGYLQFTVQVTDALGVSATIAPTFWMRDHIAFGGGTIGSPPNYCYWTGCSASFPYSGGIGTPSATVAGWSYSATCYGYPAPPNPCPAPAQPTLSIGGGAVHITVPSPGGTWINGYKATLTVKLTDSSPCGSGVNCSTTGTVTLTVQGG